MPAFIASLYTFDQLPKFPSLKDQTWFTVNVRQQLRWVRGRDRLACLGLLSAQSPHRLQQIAHG